MKHVLISGYHNLQTKLNGMRNAGVIANANTPDAKHKKHVDYHTAVLEKILPSSIHIRWIVKTTLQIYLQKL
jgi:hypothetical protein